MAKNDFRRIKKLGKYLKREKKRLILILLILIPVALAGSIQPLLVGQAISVLRGENTIGFFYNLSDELAINLIIGILFITVLLRLGLQGFQSYNIQSVGQRLTCLLYTSPSPRDLSTSRMPSSA